MRRKTVQIAAYAMASAITISTLSGCGTVDIPTAMSPCSRQNLGDIRLQHYKGMEYSIYSNRHRFSGIPVMRRNL